MNKIRVLVSGAFGRMGREVVKAIVAQDDMTLVGAVDKTGVGAEIGQVCGLETLGIKIEQDLLSALKRTEAEVMVDFTTPLAVMENIKAAAETKVAGVIGTTGLTAENLEEINELASKSEKCFLVAPNFAIGAVLMMGFAHEAAKYFPDVEIIELHHDRKLDAPSGTAIKTAELIATGRVAEPVAKPAPLEKINGARGGEYLGIKIHSVRLPGLIAHQEIIFGNQGQTLTIRHDSLDRSSFMPGVLMAIRKVPTLKGFYYGLESLVD
ncbi:MAG TPA: 4-hydroxy-tetrahydrodipicolinate reductase [Firmicutes bacterium]|mgnify:FL=1|jgi:4-hydroxy-tetrahydrodipicolinate reductase|nr:4-hydroxy-tetrahydrodipicolinate reductase [Bacillota bacterium]HBT18254.1 4-hydroxy-tetrahydrodipicolinate reductase [Bacillota bacterium]